MPVSLQKIKWLLHTALSGTLQLLMVLPENFMESDAKTLPQTLNGSSRKGNLLSIFLVLRKKPPYDISMISEF